MRDRAPGFPHTFLELLNRVPGYKKMLHPFGNMREGENLLTKQWDVCIILDACRADIFRHVFQNEWTPPHGGKLESIISLDSATEPWVKKAFRRSEIKCSSPIMYVSANPHSVEASDSSFVNPLDKVWSYGWNDTLGTVPPRVVTDRAIHHYRTNDSRMMVHYIQPHVPFLTRKDGGMEPHFKRGGVESKSDSLDHERNHSLETKGRISHHETDEKYDIESMYVFNRLRCGSLDFRNVWGAYKETLDIVLEDVTLLLQSINANRVVITADHGNAFGEWGLFGHPYHMPFAVLREVPYLRTEASVELDHEPKDHKDHGDNSTIETPDAFENKLRALGYVE